MISSENTFIKILSSINLLASKMEKDPSFSMNKERADAIIACAKKAKSKAEFKKLVKQETGYTNTGFDLCLLCAHIVCKRFS